MRIPYSVVVLTAVVFIGVFWWLRTRHMDFMTPRGVVRPLPEFMTDPVELPDLEPVMAAPVDPPSPVEEVAPEPVVLPALEFGDLESSPGLAEYSEHAAKGAAYLTRLATELETRGQFQRALLAWERVIDSCRPSTAERKLAEDAIARIRPTLPRWNVDPLGDIALLLQLGTSRDTGENLQSAAQLVAEFLRKDSDDTLLVTPRLTTSPPRPDNAMAPVAVYFTGTDASAKKQSDLLSIDPPDNEVASLQNELLTTCYKLVRRQVAKSEEIQPPAALDEAAPLESEFQRKVTRLHWKLFAEALAQPPPEKNPG